MKAVAILFVIVGIALLAVYGVGAQAVRIERPAPQFDPYPGPEDTQLTLYAGGLHLFGGQELTGTLPVVVIVDGTRFDVRGRVLNKRYNSGWQLYIDILPPGSK